MLVTVVGPFAEMSSDIELFVDLIATALAEMHVSFHADSAKQATHAYSFKRLVLLRSPHTPPIA